MDTVGSVLSYLWKALSATMLQMLLVLGPGLALALAMNYLAGFVERCAYRGMGRTWYLGLFGWLGIAVHEVGHALFCLIFGHRITEIRLFDPDPNSGTLGYVAHSYNPKNVYQSAGNLFIGIGPILLGTGVVYLLSRFLLGLDFLDTAASAGIAAADFASWDAFSHMLQHVWQSSTSLLTRIFSWQGLSNWQTYLFLYLVFAVGSAITLSPPDMRGALMGLSVIAGLWLGFNLVTAWIGDAVFNVFSQISTYCGIFYAVMLLALLLNAVVAGVILLPLYLATKAFRVSRGRD